MGLQDFDLVGEGKGTMGAGDMDDADGGALVCCLFVGLQDFKTANSGELQIATRSVSVEVAMRAGELMRVGLPV